MGTQCGCSEIQSWNFIDSSQLQRCGAVNHCALSQAYQRDASILIEVAHSRLLQARCSSLRCDRILQQHIPETAPVRRC
ncbi:hypothetical protein MRX96_049766 [Rhipicephalus microplus]